MTNQLRLPDQIDEENLPFSRWIEDASNTFTGRLVASQHVKTGELEADNVYSPQYTAPPGTSVFASFGSGVDDRTIDSQDTPSLYDGSSFIDSSISSGKASSFLDGVPRLGEDGELQSDDSIVDVHIHHCTFQRLLGCPFSSTDEAEWASHCDVHFRGQPPPRDIACHLCRWSVPSGPTPWSVRQDHIAAHHWGGGVGKSTEKDIALIKHLWNRRIIDPAQYKELTAHGCLAERVEPVTYSHSREREGRREMRGRLRR